MADEGQQRGAEDHGNTEVQATVLASEKLLAKVARTVHEPKLYTTGQVKELDDTSFPEQIKERQQDIEERARRYQNVDDILRFERENVRRIEPGRLALQVGQNVVAADAHSGCGEAGFGSLAKELLPEAGSDEERKFTIAEFDELHEAQRNNLAVMPTRGPEQPQSREGADDAEEHTREHAVREYLTTFPSQLVCHIHDYGAFVGYIAGGSFMNHRDASCAAAAPNSQDQPEDLYHGLYQSMSRNLGGPLVYDRDEVGRCTSYSVDANIALDSSLSFIQDRRNFAAAEKEKIIVDELAAFAKRYGDSHGDYLAKCEADLEFRRRCVLQLLLDNVVYDKTMKKAADQLQGAEESQILKLGKEKLAKEMQYDGTIHHQPEMRLQDSTRSTIDFLETAFMKYIDDTSTQEERDQKVELVMQNLLMMQKETLFEKENEQLGYTKGEVLEEDLIDCGVDFELNEMQEPCRNDKLEEFLGQYLYNQQHTNDSLKIDECFKTYQIPLAKEIEVFEYASSHTQEITRMAQCMEDITRSRGSERQLQQCIREFANEFNILLFEHNDAKDAGG